MKRFLSTTGFRGGFTLAEVVISVFVFGIALIGIVNAFKETFGVLNYIGESINGSYLAKNGIEEVIATRNICLTQYQSSGWSKFVSTYSSGTYVLAPVRTQCEYSMSGITDTPASYEGPLNAFGEMTASKNGVHYFRKIDVYPDPEAFYLRTITRSFTASGDTLDLEFTQTPYNQANLLLSVPLDVQSGSVAGISSPYGDLYNIDGDSDSGGFSNLGDAKIKYSKILSYDGVSSVSDGDTINLTLPSGQVVAYEFDSNGALTNPTAIAIDSSSANMDIIQDRLCKKINELDTMECRLNRIYPWNLSEKLFWTNDAPPISFWSGFVFSLSGSTIRIILGSGATVPTAGTNQYINPSYLIRTVGSASALSLRDDRSDTTAGKGVLIPDRPAIGGTNSETWFPSLLNVKVTMYLYDSDEFVESSELSMKIGDIGRYSY